MKDVARYKEFVPWCVDSKLSNDEKLHQTCGEFTNEQAEIFFADLTCGFLKITETYTSKVVAYEYQKIEAEAINSDIFKQLKSVWTFTPVDGGCWVEFSVDFEFKSYLYGYVANIFFYEVSKGMTAAFENRCKKLQGSED